jgi:hypothetical protein
MPTWISKMGVWEPANEYVVDPSKPKGKEIYEGPDRAALEQLKEEGRESLGSNIPHTDMLVLARQLGFDTVDEYLDKMVPGAKQRSAEAYNKAKGIVETHADPMKKKGVEPPSGGDNTAPGASAKSHRKGGFELPSDVPNARV